MISHDIYENLKPILKIQKFRRVVSYTGLYCFVLVLTCAYTSNTYLHLGAFLLRDKGGVPRVDRFYASYPHGGELLIDTAKWGPIEFAIMSKHFDRQGKPPYQYMAHLLSQGQLDGSGDYI
ncbi:hypothetical protein MKW92_035729 [Papaver armeniacum]|nr:hypothetical protein MKW92_035729 [Papaver armeniacum]